MNSRLKRVKDGTGAMHRNEVVWFDIAQTDGSRKQECGEIYWPFALTWNCATADENRYTVTHLPSGYSVVTGNGLPRRKAIAFVKRLRTKGDWSFTKPVGRKYTRLVQAVKPIVQRAQTASLAE